MKELLNATQISRVLRCQPAEVRHKMRTGKWKFGRVLKPDRGGGQCSYEATIGEVSKYFDLTREEVERRLVETCRK